MQNFREGVLAWAAAVCCHRLWGTQNAHAAGALVQDLVYCVMEYMEESDLYKALGTDSELRLYSWQNKYVHQSNLAQINA